VHVFGLKTGQGSGAARLGPEEDAPEGKDAAAPAAAAPAAAAPAEKDDAPKANPTSTLSFMKGLLPKVRSRSRSRGCCVPGC
jgi:hypothetical protein